MKTKLSVKSDPDQIEHQPLLTLDETSDQFHYLHSETAVMKGAIHYLGQWPSHLLMAFVVGCLTLFAFVICGLIAITLATPSAERCRSTRNIDTGEVPNVYFIKHENRTWHPTELCYIETTARTYPDLKVYLINLLTGNHSETLWSDPTLPLNRSEQIHDNDDASNDIIEYLNKFPLDNDVSTEERSRKVLATSNSNIRNLDVPVEDFFRGSRLAKVCENLNQDMLEMAARAFILWNLPGVALNPSMYENLKYLKKYLCNGQRENKCVKDNVAAVELNGDIQASSVPCQAFMDQLIREIAINEIPDQQTTMRRAINEFCPRPSRCKGLRIFSSMLDDERSEDKPTCPTIFPSGTGKR